MIIILEGPEAAGKSTLARKMSAQTGYDIVHNKKPESEEDRLRMFDNYKELAASGRNVIVDRCWYSEIVYGKVMRDQSYISTEEMLELEKLILTNGGGMVIHCTDETRELWKRMKARGDDYIKEYHHLRDLTYAYDALFHQQEHWLPIMRYELSKKVY